MSSRVAWSLALLGVLAALAVAIGLAREDRSEAGAGLEPRRDGASAPTLARGRSPQGAGAGSRGASGSAGAAALRGQVSDPDGGPLTEGRLDAYCVASVFHASTTIGSEGEFELPACASGPTCVRLTHPSYEQDDPWVFEPGVADAAALAVARAPTYRGWVFVGDPDDVVSDAELLVLRPNADPVVARADADGRFELAVPRSRVCDPCDGPDSCRPADRAEDGQLLVSSASRGLYGYERAIEQGMAINLSLADPAAPLLGSVLGRDGEPFDARTRILASNRRRAAERYTASVDASGRFRLGLPADGEFSLRAIRDEREIAALALARAGEEIVLRSELPARSPGLIVVVVDGDGEPIVGAWVDGGPFRAALTDERGRVEAPDVAPGRYSLRVRAGDCPVVREAIEVEADPSADARWVQLRHAC